MPDTLLLETEVDRFLLEDATGFLLMEVPLCYYDVVMADAPVSYWRLGEPSGDTTAVDVLGVNPGTYTATPTLDVVGALTGDTNTATTLNGTTQYVSVADSASLGLGNGPLSYECWAKRSSIGATSTLMSKGSGPPIMQFLNTNDRVRFYPRGVGVAALSSVAITDTTTWHHYVGTRTAAVSWLIYIDGFDVTTREGGGGTSTNNVTAMEFGRDSTAGTQYLPGSIDEVAVYNYVLTPAQIQTHYNSASTNCARHFGPIVLQAMNRAATR